jgi:hypothetical protein
MPATGKAGIGISIKIQLDWILRLNKNQQGREFLLPNFVFAKVPL